MLRRADHALIAADHACSLETKEETVLNIQQIVKGLMLNESVLTIQQIMQGDVDRSVEAPNGRFIKWWPNLVLH